MKRAPKPQAAALRIDTGPTIRLARGDVEVADRADIDNPNATVRGASLYDPLRRMLLDNDQRLAAELFRDAFHLAEGVREAAQGGTPVWARGYTDRWLDAVTATRQALQVVGLRLSAVFVGVVIGRARPRELERELRLRNGEVSALIHDALTRLVAHYGGSRAARVVRLEVVR